MYPFKNIKNDYVHKVTPSLFDRVDIELISYCIEESQKDHIQWGLIEMIDSELFSDVITELKIDDFVLQTEILCIRPNKCIPVHTDEQVGTFSMGIGIKNSHELYMLEISDMYTKISDENNVNIPLTRTPGRSANVPSFKHMNEGIPFAERICQQKSIIGNDVILSNTKNYHTAANYNEKTAWMLSFRLNEKFDNSQYLNYTI